MNPMLKNALELGPILIWVVLNWLLKGVDTDLGNGQTLALIIFIGLSVVSVAWLWLAERKTPWLPLVSAILITFFGVLTIVTGDPNFIMAKPTIMWLGLAGVFGGFLIVGRNLFQLLLAERMPGEIPDAAWNGMAWRYVGIFVIGAIANEGLRFYINSMDIPAGEMLDPYGRLKLFIVVGVMVLSVISALPLGRYLAESQDEQDKA